MKMTEMKGTELHPHPMNELLFDDIEGEKWEEFLTSVQIHGIMTPLVITTDGTVVSGHQRIRACHALHIETVPCRVLPASMDEDAVLHALIESNIRQRGVINSPSVKLGRMIAELERIHGIDGRRGKVETGGISCRDIREHLGVDKKVANCSKAIAAMPEEMQEYVENGSITPRTAYDIVCKLTPEQQVELAKKLDPVQKYTQAEIKAAIERFFPKAKELEELQARLAEYQQNDGELELREKLREAQTKERQTFEELQAEKRARKKEQADHEKRMDAMEKLLDENGGDSAEIDRLIEERDQAQADADAAQADADIQLVICLTGSMSGSLAEVANDPRPLAGQGAGSAFLLINQLQEKLEQIKERLIAGDGGLADVSD